MNTRIEKFSLKEFTDDRGVLVPYELQDSFKRAFWVTGVRPGLERGNHAHRMTKQCLICLRGVIKVRLSFDGMAYEDIFLYQNEAVIVPPLVWDSQTFSSEEDILLVLCNNHYDREDYINNVDELKQIKNAD